MSVYLLAGPLVAVIGIVSVFFVMRHKSVQTKSMYSSRRSQIERKVKAARQRTLAPRGRGDKAPTDQEIAAAATPMSAAPAYEAPRQSAWDVGPTPAPAYAPPPTPDYSAPSSAPAEPSTPAPSEPVWTPSPSEEVWTPAPAPAAAPAPMVEPAPAEPAVTPSGGGAAWSIVGGDAKAEEAPAKGKEKDRRKDQQATGSWQLSSGDAPGAEGEEEIKKPSAAMAIAQYAVLVVGLVMVLIGVLVMVANSHVT